jgi:hypothetical protein
MASLSILMESMKKSIQNRQFFKGVNSHFFELGFNWFDKNNSKDWNGYQSAFGNQIDSVSRGYLARLLTDELKYSPDKDGAIRMHTLLNRCLPVLPVFRQPLKSSPPLPESPELLEVFAKFPELQAKITNVDVTASF